VDGRGVCLFTGENEKTSAPGEWGGGDRGKEPGARRLLKETGIVHWHN